MPRRHLSAGVATFSAVSADAEAADRADLARLLGRNAFAAMFSRRAAPPPDREPVFVLGGRQTVRPAGAGPGAPVPRPAPNRSDSARPTRPRCPT